MQVKQGPYVGKVSGEAFAKKLSRTLQPLAHFGAKVETYVVQVNGREETDFYPRTCGVLEVQHERIFRSCRQVHHLEDFDSKRENCLMSFFFLKLASTIHWASRVSTERKHCRCRHTVQALKTASDCQLQITVEKEKGATDKTDDALKILENGTAEVVEQC